MKLTKNDILFNLALIFAFWFAYAGIAWAYWFALFFAYPFAITSFIIWNIIRKDNKKRNKLVIYTLIIGLVLSISTLVYLLIWD